MIFAVAAFARTTAATYVRPIGTDPPPDPITSISLLADRVDWAGYVTPSDFAGYDVRYTTTAGQSWAQALDLAPGLQATSYALLSAFPATAVECLVVPVDAAGQPGLPPARQALKVVTAPPPITQIALQSDRVAWTYTPPSDFAGYDVRYVTVAGQAWPTAAKLYPTLTRNSYALLSDFPAAAVECLVAPVNTSGGVGLPEARQGGIQGTQPIPIPLAPTYGGAWTEQAVSGTTATLTQDSADLRLTGGTLNDFTQDVTVVSLGQHAPPFVFEHDYTGLDSNTGTGGPFGQVAFFWATGSNPNVASALPATTQPGDQGWAPVTRGVRLSIDLYNNATQVRGRAYDGSVWTSLPALAIQTSPQPTFAWPRGGLTHVKWTLPGDDTITVSVTWPTGSNPSSTTQTFQDAAISTLIGTTPVNIALLASAGRDTKWANAILTPTTGGGGSVPPPSGGSGPSVPDGLTPLPTPLRLVPVSTNTQLATALANAQAGDFIVCAPGGTYAFPSNTINVAAGTAAHPVVVLCGTVSGSTYTESWLGASISGRVAVGCSSVIVRGFSFSTGVDVNQGKSRVRFSRCHFSGGDGTSDLGTGDGSPAPNPMPTTATPFQVSGSTFDFCEFDSSNHVLLLPDPGGGASNPFTYRCYFHDQNNTANNSYTLHMCANNSTDSLLALNSYTLECLYGAPGTASEAWECKSTGNVVERCASTSQRIIIRHGENNRMLACRTNGWIGVRGLNNRVADCVYTGSGTPRSWGPLGGNNTYEAWLNNNNPPYPIGENTILTRLVNPILGDEPSTTTGDPNMPPTGTILEACSGSGSGPQGSTLKNGTATPTTRNATIPPRTDTGARSADWTLSQVGPNGRWSASD